MAETVKWNPGLRKELRKAGHAYIKLRDNQKGSELKSEESLLAERKNFYAANEVLFQQVIDYYYKKNSRWELGNFDMLDGAIALNAYITDTNQRIPLLGIGGSGNTTVQPAREETAIEKSKRGMLDQLVKKTDKNGTAEEQAAEEGKLSEEQRKGLQNISAWFFRNVDKAGLKAGKYSAGESAYEFVNDFILRQPARLKLMAYYLVEKKKRHNPDILDLAESQMDYIPDLEQFKDQMVAAKWKFWKRVDGSHIYWEKLGEAMRFAVNAKDMINGLPGAGEMEESGVQIMSDSGTATQTTVSAGQSRRLSALETREECRQWLIRQAVAYRRMSDDSSRSETYKKKALTKIAKEIKKTYIIMREADKQVVSEDMLDEGVGGESTKLQTAAEFAGMGETASELPGTIVDKIGLKLAHLGDADKDGTKGFIAGGMEKLGWNLEKYDLPVFQKINMVTSTVGGVVAFVSGVLSFIDMARHFKSETGGEIFQSVMDTVNKAASVSKTITKAALTGKIWSQGGEMTAMSVGNALREPMAITSIVTGTAGIIIAAEQMKEGERRYLDTFSVRKQLQGTVKDEDLDMASNINDLQARIARTHKQTAGYDAVSSGLQCIGGIFSLFGIGSIIGTLVSIAGTAVGIAKSIHEYFLKKANQEAAIDAYLGIHKVEADIIGVLASEVSEKEKLYSQMKDTPIKSAKMQELEPQRRELAELKMLMERENLRSEIRRRGAAMAGYPSQQSFYEKIVGDYATFLYSKIFYNNAGEVITKTMRADDARGYGTPERKLYERMLNNSGLKALYPDTDRDEPKPSIANIARKLHI